MFCTFAQMQAGQGATVQVKLSSMPQSHRVRKVLLLIETSRAYGRGLVEGVARYAEESGRWSIYFEERGLNDPLPRWLRQWHGDGIISRTLHKADLERLVALRLPLVELYAGAKSKVPRVCQDEIAVASLASEHFFDRGLQNLAFFSTNHAHWIESRRRAFEQVMQSSGLSCTVFDFPPNTRTGCKKARSLDDRDVIRWVRKLSKPCGIFCASDLFAMRLLRACRSGGIAVPEEVAVLGVDNDPVFCGTSYPRLSSIDLGSERIGYEAAALLDRMMSGKPAPKENVCIRPNQIFVRESTDILAIDDVEMAQAVRMMREQACLPLKIAQVAEAVGLSRRVFEQRFCIVLGRSPKEEILRVRMDRAKMLLATSDLSVATVAKKSGFTSLEYFTRAFRKHAGMTPRAYRSSQRLPTMHTKPQ
jgi:LacI family transcriptional regulator